MNTYELSKEYEALRVLTTEEFDEETGELIDNSEAIKALLDELDSKRDDKLKGIEYIKREFESINAAIDIEKKRLDARKKVFTRKIENMKDLQVYLLDGEKVETDLFTFSFRKSTSVNIDDVLLATLQGKFVEEKTTFTIKKAEIKKALVDGEEVKGAHLETKQNLQVK